MTFVMNSIHMEEAKKHGLVKEEISNVGSKVHAT